MEKGIAVLHFDFTGLGNSNGDFSNTNFSSNVQDLVAAADFLRDNCEEQNGIKAIMRNISFKGDLDEQQAARFLEIADKCPVHKTLHSQVAVISKLVA